MARWWKATAVTPAVGADAIPPVAAATMTMRRARAMRPSCVRRADPASLPLAVVMLMVLFLFVEAADPSLVAGTGEGNSVQATGTGHVNVTNMIKHREVGVEEAGVGQGIGRRCWTSADGRHRCQANVFFFGASKCGELNECMWSRWFKSSHPCSDIVSCDDGYACLWQFEVFALTSGIIGRD